MNVEPASIEQIRQAADGRVVLISAEESTIAADLQRIDKRLRLSRNDKGGFWTVYEMPEGGCPCPKPDCEHGHLVLTATSLDDRIVKRVEFIDPQGRGGYSFADALEQNRNARLRAERNEREEFYGDLGEKVAHALRKDLGEKYKGRVFKPREI
jgi:hypothetical protein